LKSLSDRVAELLPDDLQEKQEQLVDIHTQKLLEL
jgi:hypothetical protein